MNSTQIEKKLDDIKSLFGASFKANRETYGWAYHKKNFKSMTDYEEGISKKLNAYKNFYCYESRE